MCHLGALLGSLGSLWTPLGIPWPLLGTPWPPFGTSGDPMWHLWEFFGHSLGPLEGAWRPKEGKKYMRIKREAAGQEEKERELNLTENSNNCILEGQKTYHIICALPVHLLRQVYKLS